MSLYSSFNTIEQDDDFNYPVTVGKTDLLVDLALVMVVTALAFGLPYHPYFFGDELILHHLAIQHDYSFWTMFREINTYKPRLIDNGITALLAKWQMARWVSAALQVGCVVWINGLLYVVVRYLFKGDRVLAWLLIATVLTSRYGMVFYFDYNSGLLDLLSTALLLSVLVAAWLAWRGEFNRSYAAGALVAAVLCIFVHERYVAGLLAIGLVIAIAECVGSSANRRTLVVSWALSLGVLPLLLFLTANNVYGSMPITTGTAAQVIELSWDTVWTALTYGYNVFLGGNYGQGWYWGTYNHLHPTGVILGYVTAACTVVLAGVIVLRKQIAWRNRWLAASLATVATAMIVVASLPGSAFHQARWMFPVGILVALTWIIVVKGIWRHAVIALILATNLMYFLLASHDSMAQVYASRRADSLAGSLLGVGPNGKSGIVVGSDDSWTIGGNSFFYKNYLTTRPGDTFSKVNLKSAVHIDPYVAGREFDPTQYDFGLAFDHLSQDLTARYRLVPVATAFVIAGLYDTDSLPVSAVLGSRETWKTWQWNAGPVPVDGAVSLRPGMVGTRHVPAADLDSHWLVYRARATVGSRVPLRLQVNWNAENGRFLSASLEVVYPNETWRPFALLLYAPPGAHTGVVYATLHDGAEGLVELQSVESK